MPYLGQFILAIAKVAEWILSAYSFIIVGSAILSFVNPDPYNPIVQFLRQATEPAFAWVRRLLPFVMLGMLDLSPVVLLLAIQFFQLAVVNNLIMLANRMIMTGWV
ncbi:MAG: hypothetical protein CSA22_01045 [Deltaproteobacteria bacterium]|nr:MAG: hypothetical protein CSA22_01045 [Deltaproteobacteria bacterium]